MTVTIKTSKLIVSFTTKQGKKCNKIQDVQIKLTSVISLIPITRNDDTERKFIMKTIQEQPANSKSATAYNFFTTPTYLYLGFLLATTSMTYTYDEEQIGQEIQHDIERQAALEKTLQDIDEELYAIFNKFFDEKDTTPFTKMITKVVALLKLKKTTLPEADHAKCDEIIKSLEKNKHNFTFFVWARILISPDLMDLLSTDTRKYIDSIPLAKKIDALRYKLNNHNSHGFF